MKTVEGTKEEKRSECVGQKDGEEVGRGAGKGGEGGANGRGEGQEGGESVRYTEKGKSGLSQEGSSSISESRTEY